MNRSLGQIMITENLLTPEQVDEADVTLALLV